MRISKNIPHEKFVPVFKTGKVKRFLDGLVEEVTRLENRPYGFIMTLPLMIAIQTVMLILALCAMPFLVFGYCVKAAYYFFIPR